MQSNTETNSGDVDALELAKSKFAQKMFTVITVQMALTFLICLIMKSESSKRTVSFQGIPILIGIVLIACAIWISALIKFCFRKATRQTPVNLVILLTFTMFFTSGMCILMSKTKSLAGVMGLGLATAVTAAQVIHVSCCRRFKYYPGDKGDLTVLPGFLFAALVMAFIFAISAHFTNMKVWWSPAVVVTIVIFVLFYVFFLLYDAQQMVSARKKHQIELDDYIFGSIVFYFDLVGCWLELLYLFGGIQI